MSRPSHPTTSVETNLDASQPLSAQEREYLFPSLTFPPEPPTLIQQSRQQFIMSRRSTFHPAGMDPLGFIRQHSSSNIRLLNASLAMVDHNPMILHTVRPGTRYIFLVMKAIRFMNDMFPFHRKIFDSLEIPQWGRVFKYLWVLAKVKWWDKYIDWLGYEAFDDDPKQLSMKQYHNQRVNPPFCESHFVSCAPPVKPTYTTIFIRVTYPFNIPYRLDSPPRVAGWYEYYVSPDTLTDTMEPGALTPSTNPGTLTPSTNPGALKPYEMKVWFSQGGAILDPTESWKRYSLPQPAESVDVKPDISNASEADEEQYHALLEFRADPEASLMRRIKEKLGFLSKKERNEIFKEYVERQREEIELDTLRELNGENAADAAAMWEQDEQAESEDDAALPDCDYGYVPAHPVLSERECWHEFWEYYYSLTISERNKFVEGLTWYSFNLPLHVKWYAIRQEEAEKIKKGEAVFDPTAPIFPPNPASVVELGDEKPHVLLACGALPWGNHFMSTMHLATMAIYTTQEMVSIMAKEAREQAMEARDAPTLPENVDQILADMDEAYKLIGELGGTLKKAEKLACTWLSRAIEARVFYPDTDELTDYEEMNEGEEWFPPEQAEATKKKGKGKKKKKGKKDKGKAKATGDETEEAAAAAAAASEAKPKTKKKKKGKKTKTEDPIPPPPSPPFFDYMSLLAEEEKKEAAGGPSNTTTTATNPDDADREYDLTVPGYTFARVSDAFTTSAAGLASLADRDSNPAAPDDDSGSWAERWEEQDEDDKDAEYRHRGGAAVPHPRNEVTGREGAGRIV